MSADLKSDLAPFYGPQRASGVPISRQTFREILAFYRGKVVEMERVPEGCGACRHFSLGHCGKWEQRVPADHVLTGCDEWQWDEIPF